MRRLSFAAAWALLLVGIACLGLSERTSAFWQSRDSNYNVNIASGSNCTPGTHASNFLARTSLSSGTTLYNAYCNLINGLDTDGTFSSFDLLYVFATDTTTDAKLNLVQNNFNLTANGTCTFTANQGYACDGSTGYFATGFTPSVAGGAMTATSAHLGACVFTSRTTVHNYVEIGAQSGVYSYIDPLETTGTGSFDLQSTAFPSTTVSNAQGNWTITRASSAGTTIYLNGTSINTPTDAGGALVSHSITVGAFDDGGTIDDFSTDQIGAAYGGGALTGTQVSNVYSRLHTFFSAVGAPSGC